MEATEAIEFLRTLRTVRRFTDQPVPQAVVDDLLTVARWSGSASNRQHWAFVVIRDRVALRRLSVLEGYIRHLAGAALAIVLVMDGDPARVEQETFDEGVLSQRLQLAAEAHGLGSAIGWFHGEGRQTTKDMLGIPAERPCGPRSPLATRTSAPRAPVPTRLRRGSRSPRSSMRGDSVECCTA